MFSLGALGIHDTNTHALNLVFAFIDHVISARPVRLLHAIFVAVYGAVYILFTVVYWSFDKTNNIVYPILDYNLPGTAIPYCVGLCVVGLPLIQLLWFGLYRFKLWLCVKLYGFEMR